MPDRRTDALADLARSATPLAERASALLADLCRRTSHDGAWLTVRDHELGVAGLVACTGLDPSTTALLDRPGTAAALLPDRADARARAVTLADLPSTLGGHPGWRAAATAAGFHGGVGATVRDEAGRAVGFLGLLRRDAAESSDTLQHVERLRPALTSDLAPRRVLLDAARLVPDATAGVALLPCGTTRPLPGTGPHPLLLTGAPTIALARRRLSVVQVVQSFLWPSGDDGSHARLTVVSTLEVSSLVCGLVLLSPDADSHGLTPRELEVLGLLVGGRSNQQIATRLAVAPRTVAAHVEHVMRKLRASSRTLAAVRAERLGLFVPPTPRAGREG